MTDSKLSPSAEYRFFMSDPNVYGTEFFRTKEEAEKEAENSILRYLDDGWSEDADMVYVGEVIGISTQCDVQYPIGELDEEGCDEVGDYFGEHEYLCNYKLKKLDSAANHENKLTWKSFSDAWPPHDEPILVRVGGVVQFVTYAARFDESDNNWVAPYEIPGAKVDSSAAMTQREIEESEWVLVESIG